MNIIFRIKKKYFISICCFFWGVYLPAQQIAIPVFSIYAPALGNPSMNAARPTGEVYALARQQFVGFNGAPSYKLIAASLPIRGIPCMAGISFSTESKGLFFSTQLSGSYCYSTKISGKTALCFGATAGYLRKSFSFKAVVIENINDPNILATNSVSNGYFLNAGLSLISPKFSAGIAVPNLTENKLTFTGQTGQRAFYTSARHFFLNTSFCTTETPEENFSVRVDLAARYVVNAPLQFDAGARIAYKDKISIGIYYRSAYAIGAVMRAEIKKQFYLGYAYDYILTTKKGPLGYSHELFLGYIIRKKTKARKNPQVNYFNEYTTITEVNGKKDTVLHRSEKKGVLPDSLQEIKQLNFSTAKFFSYNGVYVTERSVSDFYFSNGNPAFLGFYIVNRTGQRYNELVSHCPVVPDSIENNCDVIFDRYSHKFYLFNKRCYELTDALRELDMQKKEGGQPLFILRLIKEEE